MNVHVDDDLLTESSRVGGDSGALVDPVVASDVKVDSVVVHLKIINT